MDCEIILQPSTSVRGVKMLRAMADASRAAGVKARFSDKYTGSCDVLMSYGLGHMGRRPWIEQHRRNGGRVIGWDLGYWGRDVPHRFNMRMTLDDDHPHRWIRPMPPERFDRQGIKLRNDSSPDGPVILVGQGRKQRKMLGCEGMRWERDVLKRLRQHTDDSRILYRPKVPGESLAPLRTASGPIEDVLRGASLVVCAHSNVAVDACIAGVPVVCEDGAAHAIYRDDPNPSPENRLEFLRSLAWWNWNPTEAKAAWAHIREVLTW